MSHGARLLPSPRLQRILSMPSPTSAIVSLLPLDVIGGGERFTINACASAIASGHHVDLWGAAWPHPPVAVHSERMKFEFRRLSCTRDGIRQLETVSFRELLRRQGEYRVVHVHQHLAGVVAIDILAAAPPDQRVLLTSLGAEAVADIFCSVFEPHAGVASVEISRYAAQRSTARGIPATYVSAGMWRDDIAPFRSGTRPPGRLRAVSVGRLLPHKAFEVAIEAAASLDQLASLTIIGPPSGDRGYERHLQQRAGRAGNVTLAGYLPDSERCRVLADADVLIANSSHRFYCGKVVDQVELFGLVILEGLAAGLLPIASDIPSFREIAEVLGLERWLYPERDHRALAALMASAAAMDVDDRAAIVADAVARMRSEFLWDDYWRRVIGTPAGTQCGRALARVA